MTTAAILVAAGSGTRLGHDRPKALVALGGVPLLLHAARALAGSGCVSRVVVVAPAGHTAAVAGHFPDGVVPGSAVGVVLVPGGASRQASVAAGLAALDDDVDVVLVHDAARALATPALVRVVETAVRAGHAAVVPGLPVTDTIKEVGPADPAGAAPVRGTVDRTRLRAVQTPQGFVRATLEAAHAAGAARASDEARAATDDAGLCEALGVEVWVVPGEVDARKVTEPTDLALAELLLARRV
ncbi:2-C-methyl-D-erythritol 4-phosphate cytidylyltransferase [Georgenia faecalis]|uniref:2-C-methyl-D-erythritol 4-phosphate cytidylyltransferase n=1 Tax=Georgenia faecalis TaxID=2483799 RepID=A0ABV9D5W6_9MICO|nr:2-C-methyl-D-erythritol 4-phosphate cytidylyltransferase [Georgenia faecalis]